MSFSMLFRRKFCDMVSLISSNKGGDANFPIEYGDISCWLVFCSFAYSEEKCGTSEVTAWNSGDSEKFKAFEFHYSIKLLLPKE